MGAYDLVELSDKTVIAAAGIICLTILEVAAIMKGLDGTLFASVISGITLIVGYVYGVSKTSSD